MGRLATSFSQEAGIPQRQIPSLLNCHKLPTANSFRLELVPFCPVPVPLADQVRSPAALAGPIDDVSLTCPRLAHACRHECARNRSRRIRYFHSATKSRFIQDQFSWNSGFDASLIALLDDWASLTALSGRRRQGPNVVGEEFHVDLNPWGVEVEVVVAKLPVVPKENRQSEMQTRVGILQVVRPFLDRSEVFLLR